MEELSVADVGVRGYDQIYFVTLEAPGVCRRGLRLRTYQHFDIMKASWPYKLRLYT